MKNPYEERPWLAHYPDDVPSEIDTQVGSVSQAFDEATEKWGDKTAIVFYGRKISFRELRDMVDRFATALSDKGVKKGDRIALLLLNSPEYIIAFFGIAKLGAISTPISPVYVSPEIKHQLLDSGTESIVCQDILYEGVAKTGVEMKRVILTSINDFLPKMRKLLGKTILRSVYEGMAAPSSAIFNREGFYRFQDLIKDYPPNPPRVEIDPYNDLLTLPYTSGTTGWPKGVMVTHGNMMIGNQIYRRFNPILKDGKEGMVAYMPFCHIGGLSVAVVSGITRGFTITIVTTPDLDLILSSIVSNLSTYFSGAPAIYQLLKDYEKTDRVDWKKFKIIATGADICHEITAKEWYARTGMPLTEMYGMTEMIAVAAAPRGKEKINSIGIPMPNTLVAVLDPEKDEFMPVGEIGELVASGPQLSKGYWNNPQATQASEAIINNRRWWRTGDLGKMEEDGYFSIYDRKRDLIKYKGLRVFAREVEEVLKGHPMIKDVGVVGVPDIRVGENVKAVIVLESDARGTVSEAEIVEYCKGKLAHYKIPKIVEFTGEIPKTDAGKVSRRDLREGEA